jgi:hypothetical protein
MISGAERKKHSTLGAQLNRRDLPLAMGWYACAAYWDNMKNIDWYSKEGD